MALRASLSASSSRPWARRSIARRHDVRANPMTEPRRRTSASASSQQRSARSRSPAVTIAKPASMTRPESPVCSAISPPSRARAASVRTSVAVPPRRTRSWASAASSIRPPGVSSGMFAGRQSCTRRAIVERAGVEPRRAEQFGLEPATQLGVDRRAPTRAPGPASAPLPRSDPARSGRSRGRAP